MKPSLIIISVVLSIWLYCTIYNLIISIKQKKNSPKIILPKQPLCFSLEKIQEQRMEKLYGKNYLEHQDYPQL